MLTGQVALSYETQLVTDFNISGLNAKSPAENQVAKKLTITIGGDSLSLLVTPSLLVEGLEIGGSFTLPENYEIYEGIVEGIPDSWVRITRSNTELYGLVDTGDRRFQISTSIDDISFRNAEETRQIVERLHQQQNYNKSTELFPVRPLVTGKAFSKVVNIGIVVDDLYNSKFNGSGMLRAIAVVNNVDGIYREELGIAVRILVAILAKDQDFSTLEGATPAQLSQFRQFRMQTAELQQSLTLVHLFTGSNPPTASNGVGYAYIGAVCQNTGYDIGVSAQFSLDTELAAHEIGHNLGAPHDSNTINCSTVTDRIMSPVLNGATAFSSCSIERINATLKDASCVSEVHDGSINLRRSGSSGFIVQVKSTSNFTTAVSAEVLVRYEGEITELPDYCFKEGSDTLNCVLPLLIPNQDFEFFVNLNESGNGSREIVAEYNEEGVFELDNSNNIASIEITGTGSGLPLSSNTGSLFTQQLPIYTNLQSNTPVSLISANWDLEDITSSQIECRSHYWNNSQGQYLADNTSYYRYKHTAFPGSSIAGETTVAFFVRGSEQIITSTALNQSEWNISGGRYSGPAPFARSAYVEIVDVDGGQQNAIRSWTSNTTFDLCTAYPDTSLGFSPHGSGSDTSACIDTPPLNDGWGWDGANSCRTTSVVQSDEANSAAVVFKSTNRPVIIDGLLENDEWELATTQDTNGASLTLPVAIAGIRIDRAIDQWKVMHDPSNLYIALVVPDKTPFKDSVLYRHDDSVEIFIDAGNDRGLRYDSNDSQYILRESGEVSGIFNSGANIVHSRRYDSENQHFVYEIQIGKYYTQLGGEAFGLNVQVNNDQNGGTQDAKWGWVGEAGKNVQWFRPSSFGIACLDTGVITAECGVSASSCIDTGIIGDGWGWNGTASCRVEGNATTCVDTGIIGYGWGWNGTASCRIEGSDTACVDTGVIGDGWGWNGTSSCRVEGSNTACVDTGVIGDGWGWNGTSSCRVAASSTSCVDTGVLGDGWGWDGVQSCRVN